jgi:molybdenum cofactor sulfurtransferase
VRNKVLNFFNANPAYFDIIFTANATGAIRLAIECARDYASQNSAKLWYGYHSDSHTSVVGARELADIHACLQDDNEVEEMLDRQDLAPQRIGLTKRPKKLVRVFAYPAQSNMTGRRLPLAW